MGRINFGPNPFDVAPTMHEIQANCVLFLANDKHPIVKEMTDDAKYRLIKDHRSFTHFSVRLYFTQLCFCSVIQITVVSAIKER
jgi:hypothetical protein